MKAIFRNLIIFFGKVVNYAIKRSKTKSKHLTHSVKVIDTNGDGQIDTIEIKLDEDSDNLQKFPEGDDV